ncbi:MAG: Peptidase protein [Dehalococcoidia bacterium]|nr:Peptidase protein [Dehalococcoidia bacterium]
MSNKLSTTLISIIAVAALVLLQIPPVAAVTSLLAIEPDGSSASPIFDPKVWEIIPLGGIPGNKAPEKLDTPLAELSQALSTGGITTMTAVAHTRGLKLEGDGVRIVVVSEGDSVEPLTPKLGEMGVQLESVYENLLQAIVPVAKLEAVSQLPGVSYLRNPFSPVPAAVMSEGVASAGIQPWQSAGFRGRDVKVGVVDVGYNEYQDRLGVDLPSNVIAKSWRSDGDITGAGSGHGTAVAEIVYDMAPEAQLYLANFGTEVEFGSAVNWLIEQRVEIIVSAIGWPATGPGDGTGSIANIVKTAKDRGALWVQAAGNFGSTHWAGRFRDTNGNGYHEFVLGDEGNTITLARSGRGELIYRIEIILTWDDWDTYTNDYDLFLLKGDSVVAQSTAFQNGQFPPVERIVHVTPSSGDYWIAIQRFRASKSSKLELFVTTDYGMEYKTSESSLIIPADSPDALTVGAVPVSGEQIQPYSSRGPTKDGRVKPDMVAYDSVSTATFGPGQFMGTSASAPHVAGAAALIKQALPWYTPAQIQALLQSRAIQLPSAPPGKNNSSGAGRLDLGQPPPRSLLPLIVNGATLPP